MRPGGATPAQQAGGGAEALAARFLERHGLAILHRNYRTRLGEIDLVAREADTLVFVEVRLRRGHARFGGAAASVDHGKRARLVAAARHFLMRLGREPNCRFDVVTLDGEKCEWLRGAFECA